MPKISGPKLRGKSGRIRQGNRAPITFENFGIQAPAAPPSNVLSLRNNYIVPEGEPDEVEILSVTDDHKAFVRADKVICLDLLDEYLEGGKTITVNYSKKKDGVTTLEQAVLDVAQSPKGNGWSDGDIYMLEKDPATGLSKVEPSEKTRRIFVVPNGTEGAITINEVMTRENKYYGQATLHIAYGLAATGENGAAYGSRPDLAITQKALEDAWNYLKPLDNEYNIWILWQRGHSYDNTVIHWAEQRGESALHPSKSGAWGVGADPVFTNTRGPIRNTNKKARNIVVENFRGQGIYLDDGAANVIVQECHFYGKSQEAHPMQVNAAPFNFGVTFQEFTMSHMRLEHPYKTPDWDRGLADKIAGVYVSYSANTVIANCAVDHHGWGDGYRADAVYYDESLDEFFEQIPTMGSHDFYLQYDSCWTYVDSVTLSRGSLNGLQARSGGIIQNVVLIANNSHLLIGDADTLVNGSYARGNGNSYTFVDNVVIHKAGMKQWWNMADDEPSVSLLQGTGISDQDEYATYDRIAVVNMDPIRDDINIMTGPDSIGPCAAYAPGNISLYKAIGDKVGPVYEPDLTRMNVQVANWDRPASEGAKGYEDVNIPAGVTEQDIQDATAENFADMKAGTSGNSYIDLLDRWNTPGERPWDAPHGAHELEEFIDFMRDKLGNDVTRRATGTTVFFNPPADGKSPGNNAFVRRDWSSKDWPGTWPNDSVNMGKYANVVWNLTPKWQLQNFTFEASGEMPITAGIWAPQGTITVHPDGQTFDVRKGGKAHLMNGYNGANPMYFKAAQGRFLNAGSVAGKISVSAYHDGIAALGFDASSFTVSDGEELEVFGGSRVGFDGANSESAALVIQPGGKISFKPTLRLYIDVPDAGPYYQPKRGHTITGLTSGATATVRDPQLRNTDKRMIVVDNVVGTFLPGESLSCFVTVNADFHRGVVSGFGTIDEVVVVVPDPIRKFPTGLNGFDDGEGGDNQIIMPNVTVPVTINGGTLQVDILNWGEGAFPLVALDAIAGDFDTVVIDNGEDKDVTITTDTTANTISMSIVAGTGQVNQATV
ncbi:MAG: hypothetical protein ACU0FH_02210 [Heliomarina sp.]|uniref:hypothetical protein n=1 Tax=Heliomarina sp. TaxID=2917556 RepID=UPI0040596D1F